MTDAEIHQIKVPLTEFIREVVRETVAEVWKEHRAECPVPAAMLIVEERVRKIELKAATLVGYMVGAGIFGGGTAAVIVRGMFGG